LYKNLWTINIKEIYHGIYCKIKRVDKQKILSWETIIAGARLGEYIKDEREEEILKEMIKNG